MMATNGDMIEVMSLDARIYKNKDIVPAKAYDRVRWERDIAIGQLKELGFGLGEKVEPVVRKSKIDKAIEEIKALADSKNTILDFNEKMGLKTAMNILVRTIRE